MAIVTFFFALKLKQFLIIELWIISLKIKLENNQIQRQDARMVENNAQGIRLNS